MLQAATQRLRQLVTKLYLWSCFTYVKLRLKPGTPARDFSRVRIVAAFQRHNGITMGATLQAGAMQRRGIDAQTLDATAVIRNLLFRIPHTPASAYVFHAGGPQIANLMLSVLPAVSSAYRIAYLAWELATPPDWPNLTPIINEIWTTSEYSRQSLLQAGYTIPINVVPHNIPSLPRRVRGAGPFQVLVMADARSGFIRKNPAGAVAAFIQAFGDSADARLLLKLTGKGTALVNFDPATRTLIETQTNIELIDGHLSDPELDALLYRADVLLSLHRGEGFGIPMLEAMARGIPVIATGYSGNLQFMDEHCAALIGYSLTSTMNDPVYGHYKAARWADPDITEAAAALKRLATDRLYYETLARAGYDMATRQNDGWSLPL